MLPKAPKTYDIAELSDLSGLTVRTIRYYIQQRLLPSSQSMGPGARYAEEHLARLHLIRRLQREAFSLAQIRDKLLASPDLSRPEEAASESDAAAYIRSVIGGAQEAPPSYRAPPPASGLRQQAGRDRWLWERIPISDEIEIHVRRPLPRVDQRALDQLLEAAQKLFKEKP